MTLRSAVFTTAFGLTVGAGNASGIALPSNNVSGWTLTMAEDFATAFSAGGVNSSGVFPSPYASEFSAYADGTNDTSANNNATNSHYKPSTNLSASGSKLVTLCNDAAGVITSATYVVTPGGNYGQLYGRFSVCYRVPAVVHGFKTAFLLWPTSGVWPRDGEVDWPEGSLYTGGVFGANFLHQGTTGSGNAPSDFDHHRYAAVPAPDGAWHVATIEWYSTFLAAYWDGVLVGVQTDRIPNTSMYWAIQTESDADAFGTGGYAVNGDTGTVEVDWVACWNPSSPTPPGAGSAPSSTNTLTEAFTGTNGTNWSGTNWNSTTTTTGGSAQIQTNKGRQTTGTVGGYGDTVYRRSTASLPADSILTVTVNITNISECYPFIAFRDATSGTGTASGYQLYFYANTSQIILANPGQTNIATVNWTTFTTATSIKVEILTQSSVTHIRLWDAAGSRPTNPTISTNTSLYTGTTCGLGLVGGSAASSRTVEFDDFAIASVP